MRISFKCPNCSTKMEIEAAASGSPVHCPSCQAGLRVPAVRLGPGVTIGGFKIERLIGIGGMGEVYLARQLSMDRPVALKILPSHPGRAKDDVDRFLHEVRMLARLEHPNIVTAHEAGEDEGILFMAMAYVNGEALDRQIARVKHMPEKDALKLVRKVARSLEYAWADHQLLHRDIKPGNILLDIHGEPKLADLGLAQSVRQQDRAKGEKPRAAGTPNYMSPEQAEGREDLDCRTDIYALGATLYHMLTGQLPYAAANADETLRRKMQESLPDPRTYVGNISPSCVALLAGMLAHERAERYPSWKELIADMDRVLAGKAPMRDPSGIAASVSGPPPADGTALKVRITKSEVEALRGATPTNREASPLMAAALIGGAVLVVILVAWLAMRGGGNKPPPPPVTPGQNISRVEAEDEARRLAADRVAALHARSTEIAAFAKDHPDELGTILAKLNELANDAKGTEVERDVRRQVARWELIRTGTIEEAKTAIRQSIAHEVQEARFDAAIQKVDAYAGPYAAETAGFRTDLIAALKSKAEEASAAHEQLAARAVVDMKTKAAACILKGDFAGASRALDDGCKAAGLATNAPEAAVWRDAVARTSKLKELVVGSFAAEAGRTIEVHLQNGNETWEIRGVVNGAVEARRQVGGGFMARTIQYAELHATEKYRRLEREQPKWRDILRGLLALEVNNPAAAQKLFEGTGEEIGRTLAATMVEQVRLVAEGAAERAFAALLRRAAVPEGTAPEAAASLIRRARFAAADVGAIRPAAAEFRRLHGASETAKMNEATVRALERVATYPREVDAALIERAVAAMKQAGGGKIEYRATEEGLEFELAGDRITSLAPLAGLPIVRLEALRTGIRDFTPLRGMPLQALGLAHSKGMTLDTLRGLPLRELDLSHCGLDSLAGLAGLQLESLNITGNKVTSIAPLTGMPLKRLFAGQCSIMSIKPLAGLPLEELVLTGCRSVDEIRSLRGMPLRQLSIGFTTVSDLTPLKDLTRIEELELSGCEKIVDFSPIQKLPLKCVEMESLTVPDLGVLRGLPLETLKAGGNPQLSSVAALKGMPLKSLSLMSTSVQDISALQGMPLEELDLSMSMVNDISALSGMPLQAVNFQMCKHLQDLRPLMDCLKLEEVITPADRPYPYLFQHPTLKRIGPDPNNLRDLHEPPATEKPAAANDAASGPAGFEPIGTGGPGAGPGRRLPPPLRERRLEREAAGAVPAPAAP